MSTFDHIKFGDNLEVTDEGSGVIRVDASGIAPSVEVGGVELIYKYTVAGSSKASIDTGADTASAGSLDWTNGDVLEVFMLLQTVDAAATGAVDIILNNDTGANYDLQSLRGTNATVAASTGLAANSWNFTMHGATGTSGYAGTVAIVFPNYTGTTFNKSGEIRTNVADATAANNRINQLGVGWRNTSAITRVKVSGSTANLAIGSQLLVYKRSSV